MKHTPTPWYFHYQCDEFGNDIETDCFVGDGTGVMRIAQPKDCDYSHEAKIANMKLIEKRVNAHDDLVEVLRQAEESLYEMYHYDGAALSPYHDEYVMERTKEAMDNINKTLENLKDD